VAYLLSAEQATAIATAVFSMCVIVLKSLLYCAEGNVSYCNDCVVVKTRAVDHGFQVAQLQDAFEVNSVQQLLGSLYNEVVAETRFDVNRHVYRISANGALPNLCPDL
jgi:hypothetical protein